MAKYSRKGGYKSDHGPHAEALKILIILNKRRINELMENIKERKGQIREMKTYYDRWKGNDQFKDDPVFNQIPLKIKRLSQTLRFLQRMHRAMIIKNRLTARLYKEAYDAYREKEGSDFATIGSFGYIN